MASRRYADPKVRELYHPDTHEILKRQSMLDEPGLAQPFAAEVLAKKCPIGVHDHFIELDTWRKTPDSDPSRGRFQWNFMIQGSYTKNAVGVKDKIENIIEVELYEFAMPILPDVPYVLSASAASNTPIIAQNNGLSTVRAMTLVPDEVTSGISYGQYPTQYIIPTSTVSVDTRSPWIHNPFSQIPFDGRFTMLMEEISSQAYYSFGGKNHFELKAKFSPDHNFAMAEAEPINPLFIYTDPIQDLQGLTLQFRNPDQVLSFEQDVLTGVTTDYYNVVGNFYLRFNYEGFNLLMGDRVYFEGYNSAYVNLNTLVNRPEGFLIAPVPGTTTINYGLPIASSSQFYTDPVIDLANYATKPASQNVTMYIAKRRMRIRLRIRGLVARKTNHIIPV